MPASALGVAENGGGVAWRCPPRRAVENVAAAAAPRGGGGPMAEVRPAAAAPAAAAAGRSRERARRGLSWPGRVGQRRAPGLPHRLGRVREGAAPRCGQAAWGSKWRASSAVAKEDAFPSQKKPTPQTPQTPNPRRDSSGSVQGWPLRPASRRGLPSPSGERRRTGRRAGAER